MKILFLSRIYNEAFDNFSLDIINTQKEIDIFFENQARFHCNWLDEFFFFC